MTAVSNEVVAVIQADRDMVQAFHRLRLNKLMEAIKDEKAGARLGEDEGDAGDLVQAFARHRIAHSDPRPVAGREDIARLIDPEAFEPTDNFDLRINRDMRRAEAFSAADRILATHSPAPMAGEGFQWPDEDVWIAQTEQERMETVKAYMAHKRTAHPSTQEGTDLG